MPFPISKKLSVTEFRDGIIKYYWSDLPGAMKKSPFKCQNPDALLEDYAKIGSFLTDKAAVEKALEPLEAEIRNSPALARVALPRSYAGVEPLAKPRKDGGSAAHLKSHKLLTHALRRFEAEAGFNHERIINGTFHDEAKQAAGRLHSTAARSDATGRLASIGKDKPSDKLSKEVSLPRGAPTVLGDLDPLAFNVLLRHGYQFKDVAAGNYHGEYTHRLQWYAIAHHTEKLTNPLIEVFRSLGFLFAKADKNVPTDGSAQLWMWQALFDTAETAASAVRLRTVAQAGNGAIFTCPENMNKSLMTLASTDTFDSNPLWCLRVLLKTRWKKRFDETDPTINKRSGMEKLLRDKLPHGRIREVLSSDSKSVTVPTGNRIKKTKTVTKKVYNPATKTFEMKSVEESYYEDEMKTETRSAATLGDAGYALVWYLREDSIA